MKKKPYRAILLTSQNTHNARTAAKVIDMMVKNRMRF